MSTLSDKVAIVTGASKGIGAGIAAALAAAGARVAVNYSSDWEGAERVAQAITDNGGKANRLTGRIVRSAVELLTSHDIQRVKECAADRCGWLFMDNSRSRNRCWCDMKTCGSREKARAYYRRLREGADR
jgi:predicted RNA-binding Zn ribbon-like protein